VTSSASPTVRRRRLAAELRRLRGNRTGTAVARGLGWSAAKVSRYELGQGSFPLEEIEKLLNYYRVDESLRTQLLDLAVKANAPAWWDDYADALTPAYMEFIGLEAEAASELDWQLAAVPGLLQTEEYARAIHKAHQQIELMSPGVVEQRVRVRMIRQKVLTERSPLLTLSAVIDESVLRRKVGTWDVMSEQLRHLAEMAKLPNVELRILPLRRDTSLMADSFEVLGFDELGDVVSTEGATAQLWVEGETDTYIYHRMFDAFTQASLAPEESRELILRTAAQPQVL